MASSKITVPTFEFSAFYYAQILEALIVLKRENTPELTDESEYEPFIQLLRAFALTGHLSNVLIDMIANECTLPTAQLPETVRNMLRLIGYELQPATPAQADVVFQLARTFATTTTVVPALGQVATKQAGATPAIFFEAIDQKDVERTDRVTFAMTYAPAGPTFTDITAVANTIGGAGVNWWSPQTAGCAIYVGHSGVMFDKLAVEIIDDSGPSEIPSLEYYDGDFQDTNPDAVVNLGGGLLQFNINGLLGTNNRAGAIVRVQFHETGAYQDVASQWDGVKNIVVTALLGQSAPSTDPVDYGVGTEWRELTTTITKQGIVNTWNWTLPQSEDQNWKPTTVNSKTGYFIRLRVVAVAGPPQASSVFGRIRIDTGTQYALALVTQGKSVINEVIGSSTGAPGQRFQLSQPSFILNSEVITIDNTDWTRVAFLLASGTNDRHYKVELGEDDKASIVTGDGKSGAVAPLGQNNVSASYRYDATENGNVGALTITVDKTGFTYVEKHWNPRKATGWAEAQSASEAGLALAKQAGPAALRTKEVALGPDDLVEMAIDFTDATGARPYSRAVAVEEGFGPKTIELIVVPRGGGTASSIQLATLNVYFNGDKLSVPPKRKRLVANQQVTATNYKPRAVNVDATVTAPPEVTAQQIINQLLLVLQPEALDVDGITPLWTFGGTIAESFIEHQIHAVDPRIKKVVLNGWTDINMTSRELPIDGTLNIVIV